MEGSTGACKAQEVSQIQTLTTTPEVAVTDYFQTKFEERIVKKRPEWDVPRMTPATELVAARRDLVIAETSLSKKRQEQASKKREMDAEWEDLKQKELTLQDYLIKFNKFVKENDEKRERAIQKITEEKKTQEKTDKELNELLEKVESMRSVKGEMEACVDRYGVYQRFLKSVVSCTTDMSSVRDILNRYETLATARNELASRQEMDLKALEEARSGMVQVTEEKGQVLMGLTNRLQVLQGRYSNAKAKAERWQDVVTRIKSISADKTYELSQVVVSAWNLYTSMCARKGIPAEIPQENLEEQFLFIKHTLEEQKRIIELVHQRTNKYVSSSKPVTSSYL